MGTWAVGIATLVVAGGVLGVARARAGATDGTVLVLPFEAEGAAPGATDLARRVAGEIGRAPEFRAAATRDGRAERDPDRARARAREADAEYVVLGEVEDQGRRVTVRAALFGAAPGEDPLARAEAEGDVSEASRLARSLARQLLAGRPYSRTGEVASARGLAGIDPSAVSAYQEGERLLHSGHPARALEHFRRAVRADSAFALGYLRLSMAAHWTGDPKLAARAAGQAARRAASLTRPDRLRVAAWEKYLSGGDPAGAETAYRALLAYDPRDVEGWYGFGELIFHWFPATGRPASEARIAFERVVQAEPGRVDALVHLARIAGMEGDPAAVDSLTAAALRQAPEAGQAEELRLIRALVLGERGSVPAGASASHGGAVTQPLAVSAAVFSTRSAAAEQIAAALRRGGRLPEERAAGGVLGTLLALQRGRPDEAEAAVRDLAGVSRSRAVEMRAMAATLPWSTTPRTELRRIHRDLDALPVRWRIGNADDEWLAVDSIDPARQQLLLGMLELRMGDRPAAAGRIRALDRLRGPDERDTRLARRYARLLEAEIRHRADRPRDALASLGAAAALPDTLLPTLLSQPVAQERWLRAELLREQGRDAAAMRIYASFPDPAGYDVAYLPMAHLRRAELHERRGELALALAFYTSALEAWSGADPAYQPLIREARQGIARVRGGVVRGTRR